MPTHPLDRCLYTPPATLDPYAAQAGGGHYKGLPIQPGHYSEKNGLSFYEGCVVKRITRHRRKDGAAAQDIFKAIHECLLILEEHYPSPDNLQHLQSLLGATPAVAEPVTPSASEGVKNTSVQAQVDAILQRPDDNADGIPVQVQDNILNEEEPAEWVAGHMRVQGPLTEKGLVLPALYIPFGMLKTGKKWNLNIGRASMAAGKPIAALAESGGISVRQAWVALGEIGSGSDLSLYEGIKVRIRKWGKDNGHIAPDDARPTPCRDLIVLGPYYPGEERTRRCNLRVPASMLTQHTYRQNIYINTGLVPSEWAEREGMSPAQVLQVLDDAAEINTDETEAYHALVRRITQWHSTQPAPRKGAVE